MRLTKIKLAGFKSFVDPTSILLPGQLVGVVGPNGCGKSNVIDAVRWVLGESKASELRGESMQDVIFNGSSGRKPVSRAVVELVFDNTLGRISGQWSQYTELSVKRLLTRTGQSEYSINNLHVRRKDITDLFLGTGLGPRAYAIIGQGTISRIIEARPDELRVFLEEAAGVTKYKERRKETESRLADTRDNLARVDDIRAELSLQMERLEAQAAVAREFRAFNEELTQKQQLLWLYRKNDAATERDNMAREVMQAVNGLEAQMASLRETEAALEVAREAHFASTDHVQNAQANHYKASAEVARLEAEIRHRRESQHEYETRLAQLEADKLQWASDVEKYDADLLRWQDLLNIADHRVSQGEMRLEAQRERLPDSEEAYGYAQDAVNKARKVLAEANQRLQVEITHRTHAERSLQMIAARRDRLQQEREALPIPDRAAFELHQEMLHELREKIVTAQETLHSRQHALPSFEASRREALAEVQRAQKERAEAHARRVTLMQLQKRIQGDGNFEAWLMRYQLQALSPLWKSLHVEPGWENAVEAVLRERVNALLIDDPDPRWAEDRPARKLSFVLPVSDAPDAPLPESLAHRVRSNDAALQRSVVEWLGKAITVPSLKEGLQRRESLVSGAFYITRAGDIITRSGLTLFAPDSPEHGLLERQHEIESLGELIAAHESEAALAQERLAQIENARTEAEAAVASAREDLDSFQEEAHRIQVETLKLSQALDRFQERQAQIEASLAEMSLEEAAENERAFLAEEAIDAEREKLRDLQLKVEDLLSALEAAERRLNDEREAVNTVERELREAEFSQRECRSKLAEIKNNTVLARKQIERIQDELLRCAENADALQAEALEALLQEALDRRVSSEQMLINARDAQESAATTLRSLEEARMKLEMTLEPMHTRIGELRLKEQAATLNYEQLSQQLTEAGANEEGLTPLLVGAKPGSLQSAISSLQRSIEALGAVNLAALDELESARERKGFLDAQFDDLSEAMQTLENAIRRIDRETRELLQSTYDTVNRNFGSLFPVLFGGGEAKLIMTGDEILDAGVQVMAQPPGKKNSTIHLLSGGEKALTAIALVFAMFQLNPAPFCLLDEVDAPLDDTNTERFCAMVRRMSVNTQFLFISHNKIAMEMAEQLVGVTMQESGVSRIVEVDMSEALRMREQIV